MYYYNYWPASHQSCMFIAFFRDLIGKEGRERRERRRGGEEMRGGRGGRGGEERRKL